MSAQPGGGAHSSASRSETYLAFDYGLRRIGVAVGEAVTGGARALRTVPARDGEPDWEAIAGLIRAWQPDALVVGVPLRLDGTAQPMTEAARRFARRLEGRYRLPVHEADERLSSDEARRTLAAQGHGGRDTRGRIDPLAAQIILQAWLAQRTPDDHDPVPGR